MNLHGKESNQRKWEYATVDDFSRIFQNEMTRLHRLALVLTGDAQQAEQCFVCGFADAAGANTVFREWAEDWARRAIIQNAIRLLAPRSEAAASGFLSDGLMEAKSTKSHAGLAGHVDGIAAAVPGLAGLLGLNAFERFVFVMSVLEHYSDQDCAILLGCQRREVICGRHAALQNIAAASAIPPEENSQPEIFPPGVFSPGNPAPGHSLPFAMRHG